MKRILILLVVLLLFSEKVKSQVTDLSGLDSVGSVSTPSIPDDSFFWVINQGAVSGIKSRRMSLFQLDERFGLNAGNGNGFDSPIRITSTGSPITPLNNETFFLVTANTQFILNDTYPIGQHLRIMSTSGISAGVITSNTATIFINGWNGGTGGTNHPGITEGWLDCWRISSTDWVVIRYNVTTLEVNPGSSGGGGG